MVGKKVILLLCWVLGLAGTARGQGAEIVHSLVNTDREFSWTMQEEGVRKGFLEYLDREGLVFMPTAINGLDYYRKQAPDSTGLFRYPTWAEISDDGLLGYTTGPQEYRSDIGDEKPASSGQYVSIWRRRDDRDKWEIILDISINHPPAEPLRQLRYNQSITGKIPITPALELVKSKQILLDSDELFNVSLRAGRLEFGYSEFYADSVQLYREGYAPVFGKQEAARHLLQMKGKYVYTTGDGYMSHVRDIAYTFGTGYYYENIRTSRFDQRFSYVRIWRKNAKGLWKVILDIEKPFEETETETP
ncbi:MAG TPA: hypothetical protein VD772_11310 [Anseongella sp.]|nr:hypothetical protein [Anseongella sp.]